MLQTFLLLCNRVWIGQSQRAWTISWDDHKSMQRAHIFQRHKIVHKMNEVDALRVDFVTMILCHVMESEKLWFFAYCIYNFVCLLCQYWCKTCFLYIYIGVTIIFRQFCEVVLYSNIQILNQVLVSTKHNYDIIYTIYIYD